MLSFPFFYGEGIMANAFFGTDWNLDTTGVIVTYPVKIKSIKVIAEAALGGENILIHDPVTGGLLFEEVCPGSNFTSQELIEKVWPNGFTLTSLGGIAGAHILVSLG